MSKNSTLLDIKKQIDIWEIKRKNFVKRFSKFSWKKLATFVSKLGNKDFFLAVATLTAQQKGPKHEKRLIKIFKGKKIKAKLNKGDFVTKNGKYYEVKCSTPSADGNVLNLVQIRTFQKIDYYLCVFVDDVYYKKNYVFLLNKKQMKYECETIGNSAHMTSDIVSKTKHREYRISIFLDKPNSETTKRWIKDYRNKKLEEKIFK